jgi:hypothetical protein
LATIERYKSELTPRGCVMRKCRQQAQTWTRIKNEYGCTSGRSDTYSGGLQTSASLRRESRIGAPLNGAGNRDCS